MLEDARAFAPKLQEGLASQWGTYPHATFSFYSFTHLFFRCYQAAHPKVEQSSQEHPMLTRFDNELEHMTAVVDFVSNLKLQYDWVLEERAYVLLLYSVF